MNFVMLGSSQLTFLNIGNSKNRTILVNWWMGGVMTEKERRAILYRAARNRRNGLHLKSDDHLERSVKESQQWRESIELKSSRT